MTMIKLITLSIVLLYGTLTLVTADRINILPEDVAAKVRGCALAAGYSTANERFGSQGEADAQKTKWKDAAYELKKLSDGIIKESTVSDIQYMFWFMAWRTANERKGYSTSSDKKKFKKYYQEIKDSEDFTDDLASLIYSLGSNVAWYTANRLYGYSDDAKRDKAKYESAYNRMHGDVKLVAMNFFINQADIRSRKPLVISEQTLINNGDINQSFTYTYGVTRGRTIETSHTFGFTYGVTQGLTVGFEGVESSFEVSFEISAEVSFSESLNEGMDKGYEFPLVVPPHSTYIAKGIVTEAEMDVPYELVFDFDGAEKTFHGTWRGVAVSKGSYQIDDLNKEPEPEPSEPAAPPPAPPRRFRWKWWG